MPSDVSGHALTSFVDLKLLDVGLVEDLFGGLGPHEGVGAVVPVVDEGADLGLRSLTEVKTPRRMAWRSMMPNQTSTRFIHEAWVSTGSVITAVTARKPDNTAMMGWSYAYAAGPQGAVLTSAELGFVDDAAIGGTATSDDENVGAATAYGYANGTVLNRVVDAREVADPALEAGGSTAVVYDSRKRVVELTRETDEEEVPDSTVRYTYAGNPDVGPNPPCHPIDLLGGQDKEAKTRTNVDGERIEAGVSDITKYCVDVHGRVKRTTDADDKSRATAWTDNSNVDAASMPGVASGEDLYDYSYDSEDNPTKAKTPEGAESGAEYEDPQNPHSPTKVRGDDTGNETDKTSWDYTYDEDNNLITAASTDGVDGPGIEYRYCWTGRGQIKRIDPVTAAGTKANSTNPKKDTSLADGPRCGAEGSQGNDTLFTYNSDAELTGVDKPTGGDESFTYDALSRIKTVTDGRGVTTSYTYDGLDRVVRAVYAKSGQPDQSVAWEYDLAGNTTSLADANGTNTFGYDELNRKTSETGQGPGGTIDYAYDPAGNVTSVEVAGEPEATTYTYDKLNRVISLDDQRPGTDVYTFFYDRKDNRTKTIFPTTNGDDLVEEARFNQDNNPKCRYSFRQSAAPSNGAEACPDAASGDLITFQGYDYVNNDLTDDAGDQGQATETKYTLTELGGRTTRYRYDAAKRLDRVETRTSDDPSSTLLRSFDYTYDRHSNLTSEQATGSTPGLETGTLWSAFDPGDQICASLRQGADPGLDCGSNTTGQTTYTHDGAGNLTTAAGGPATGLGGLGLGYTLPGQTASIDPPGAAALPRPQAYDGVMSDRRTQDGPTSMSYGYAGLNSQSHRLGRARPGP